MDILEEYKTHLEGKRSPNTVYGYLYTIRKYLWFLQGRKPDAKNADEFMLYLGGLHKNGARSLNRHLAALRHFFRVMYQMALPLEPHRLEHILPTVPGEEARDRILVSPSNEEEKAVLYTLLGSGIRLAELCGLEKKDINDAGFLRVRGKGGKERIVAVSDDVVAAVHAYLDSRLERGSRVFPHRRTYYQEMVGRIGKRAGVKLHPHLLRHMYGTRWIEKGGELADLKEQMGHTSLVPTSIYIHLVPDKIRKRMPEVI